MGEGAVSVRASIILTVNLPLSDEVEVSRRFREIEAAEDVSECEGNVDELEVDLWLGDGDEEVVDNGGAAG